MDRQKAYHQYISWSDMCNIAKTDATLQKATVKNDCDKIQRGMAIELKLKETGVIVLNS